MEVVVLGSSASAPDAGDACSGYLVRHDATTIALDLGNGTLGNLLRHATIDELQAVVITHFHPDHYLDLAPLRYRVRYGGLSRDRAPVILVPPGGVTFLSHLGVALRGKADLFREALPIVEYDPDRPYHLPGLTLRFQSTTHDIPTYAVSVEGAGRLVYTADTGPSADLEFFAAGCDLFLCEATFPADPRPLSAANHLRSVEAGLMAKHARPGRVVLTHFWPGLSREQIAREAAEAYGGPVHIAQPNRQFIVAPAPLVAPRDE
ncbi:MAG: MBL fold metallo-hydrolase [Dehalococcoidia bacterium]|nr:MBL fold metallo-hydrolase [Dehalococcoidia bacterium]